MPISSRLSPQLDHAKEAVVTSVKFICLWLWGALVIHTSAGATTLIGQDHALGSVSLIGGVDYWHIQSPAWSEPGNKKYFLFQADTANAWDFKNPHAWIRVSGAREIDSHLSVNYKFRSDQEFGNRVDDLSLDYAISPLLGFRAGVLDYKTSWCKSYETDSPWIREPDIFCAVRGANVITGGAPGLQTYTNLEAGKYRIQTAIGVYNPMLFDYDKKEFSDVLGWNQTPVMVDQNHRYGISVNLLNLQTGAEFRLGYTLAKQRGVDVIRSEINNRVNVLYIGYAKPLSQSVTLTATHAIFNPHRDITNSNLGYARVFDYRKSTTLEMLLRQSAQDVFSLGVSQHRIHQEYQDFSGAYNPNEANFQHLNTSMAWRHQMTDQLFWVIQTTWVHQKNSAAPDDPNVFPYPVYESNGRAFGIRLGYTY